MIPSYLALLLGSLENTISKRFLTGINEKKNVIPKLLGQISRNVIIQRIHEVSCSIIHSPNIEKAIKRRINIHIQRMSTINERKMAKRIDLNEHKIKFSEIQETNDKRNNI